jgi:hypothetical protein
MYANDKMDGGIEKSVTYYTSVTCDTFFEQSSQVYPKEEISRKAAKLATFFKRIGMFVELQILCFVSSIM